MREVPPAGEEHRSPGSRCSTGITSTGKALLPGLAREGGSAGKGLGRGGGRSPHTMGWEGTPCLPFRDPSTWHLNSMGREERVNRRSP